MDREVAGHETDGKEEQTEFGKEGCGAGQAGGGLGIFLSVDVEVLCIKSVDVIADFEKAVYH